MSGFREWSAFEPFVEHRNGIATFANRMHGHGVRGFPGSMVKRRRWKRLHYSWRHQRTVDEIDAASDLAAARRWLPDNPLATFAMRAEDTVIARRRSGRSLRP